MKEEKNGDIAGETIEPHLIWHEVGHLIGFAIGKKMGYFLGDIDELNLTSKDGKSPSLKVEFNKFKPKEKVHILGDGDKVIYYYSEEDSLMLKNHLKDVRGFLIYSIYILAGGLFNMYFFKKKINNSDIEKCFIDNSDKVVPNNFIARAGIDWTRISNTFRLGGWDINILINFRKEFFEIAESFKIVKIFEKFIPKINQKYNGLIVQRNNLKDIYKQVDQMLSTQVEFLKQLDLLINKYQKILNKS